MSRQYSEQEIEETWNKVKRKRYSDQEIIKILSRQSEIAMEVLFREVGDLQDRVKRLELERSVTPNVEEIELRTIPEEEALRLVKDFVESNPGCSTSDIIFSLRLDPDLVLRALNRLEKDRIIRGDDYDPSAGRD